MRKATGLIAVLLTTTLVFSQNKPANKRSVTDTSLPPAAQTALRNVNPENIRQHVRFLSHDLLEGRGTGTRGGDIAAEYIATQFALYGLKPMGDNGSYMQKVPLVGVTTVPESSSFVLQPAKGEPMKLAYKDEYVAYNQNLTEKVDIDAPIVFVGYGIEAPEYKWNDYKDVDVRGKVLLMLVNEPPSNDDNFFKGKALTYYGRWTYKYEEAARKGAIGVILIHKTDMASYGWEVVRNSNSGEKSFLRADHPQLDAASWIQLDVARALAKTSGMDLDQMMKSAQSRGFRPVEMNAKLKATLVSKIRPMQSNNVIAMLPGSDPKLSSEAVIFTAHYDHLGIRPDQPGDNIYNGAADNATGCGILLEMARAIASAPQHPKRSMIFASVTAEEQGLLGSEYLGKHPPIPAGKIVLNLNYDDLPPIGVPEEIEVVGAERTTFYPTVQATAKAFGVAIKPDSRPEAGHYYRSDHFSMARVGVPAFSINEGMKFEGHPAAWGVQQAEDYTAHRYHQPSDEYKPEMIFTGDAKMAQLGVALGWKAANAAAIPTWRSGDEFEAARKASLGQ
ncbi:MAG: peptidase [Acidobacteriaceae bacterium]|nr:peptidase [Acidobacteriaceae bacterium]